MSPARRLAPLALALWLGLAGCSGGEATTTTTTTTAAPSSTAPVSTAAPIDPDPVASWPRAIVRVGDADLLVAVADTPARQRRGLMGITELAPLAGMLFVFEPGHTGSFWMKDTPLPLTIAFFAEDGSFVSAADMDPCLEETCPVYGAEGPYTYALEVPRGTLPAAGRGLRLDIVG